ncbi:hypothetical protein BSN85_25320 [Bradyrhizobium brasilense]|nr:hypothetical protein BSN85_25320 [Bradyrhizobium brasilense]
MLTAAPFGRASHDPPSLPSRAAGKGPPRRQAMRRRGSVAFRHASEPMDLPLAARHDAGVDPI